MSGHRDARVAGNGAAIPYRSRGIATVGGELGASFHASTTNPEIAMDELHPTEELLARIAILETIAARLMAEKFQAMSDPLAECRRWFDAAQATQVPETAPAAALAERAFRRAAMRALSELHRSTEARLA